MHDAEYATQKGLWSRAFQARHVKAVEMVEITQLLVLYENLLNE